VLQLEQVLDDRADAVAHRTLQSAAHVLDLLDQVFEVQLGEAPRAQQIRLRLGPSVEILLVEIASPLFDLGRHAQAPAT
jgi:hypothetical protein